MKKIISLALSLCLALGLGATAIAIESNGVDIIINDAAITLDVLPQQSNNTTFVSYWPVVQALYPDAVNAREGNTAVVTAPGLNLTIYADRPYLVANGRYLYLPQGVKTDGEALLVPVRILGTVLGANVAWDPIANDVVLTAGTGPIASFEETYNADDLYWLSHIINAESGNQPLEGKIAVGNVVLNRVASSTFPNTVYSVIYQRSQFTPVSNGTIKLEPNEESIIAAKLCLDGANTAGNSLYFLNPRTAPNSWAARHCTYVTTIGAHAFYR